MKLADEIHVALKEYDRLSYRAEIAGKALAYAWIAHRDSHREKVLEPLLKDPQAKQALVYLKLAGKLPDPKDQIFLELML